MNTTLYMNKSKILQQSDNTHAKKWDKQVCIFLTLINLSVFFHAYLTCLHSNVTDIRRNTQSPQFVDALSIAWYNGIFYWTTGQSVVVEEYNAAQDSYYQNSYDVAKVHQPCTRLMIVHPDLQPAPVPMAPPQRVQVIYEQTRARVSWRPPPVIAGLGTFINLFIPIEFNLFRPLHLLLLP